MGGRYAKFAKNTGIMLAGNFSSKLISFLLLPVYTHYLSTASYGESDVISVYSSILLSLVTCCVADGIFVFPKKEDEEGKKRFYTTGLLFALCSFSGIAFLLMILDAVFQQQSGVLLVDKWWIYIMSFSMFIQLYSQQFALSLEKTTIYSLSGVVLTVLIAVLAIILLPLYGLSGYLLSIVLAHFGCALFTFIFSKQYLFISIRHIDKENLKKLLGYGIPLIPNSVMWWLINGLNRPLMESTLGLSAIGIYSVAYKFPSVLSMIFQVISNGMSISVIDEFDKPDFNLFYNKILRVLTVSVLLIGVILCISSKLIIRIFAAEEFFPSWQFMPVLTLAVIFQCMGSFIGTIFMAQKKSKYFFFSSLWGAVSSVGLTFLLIRPFGVMGVCIALTGSFLIMFVLRVYYAWQSINMFNIRHYVLLFAFYSMIVALVTLNLNIIIIIASVLVFISTTYLLNKQDLIMLYEQFRKKLIKQN